MKIFGQLVDIHNRDIYPAEISVFNGKISGIKRVVEAPEIYILPGLIDSHIHIESAMITPGAFGFEAVKHGTTGVVSDPHEIANVMGWNGVEFMIMDSKKSPLKFWFGAPSCVPATSFETSGAKLPSNDVKKIMERDDIKYLSEMMNFPGVIFSNEEVMKKIEIARNLNKPVDGHAPYLRGENLRKYVLAGISTDHECSSIDEAREKIALGMKVLIREGSAARNLSALKGLYDTYPDSLMLCSDDLHPEMLTKGHINKLIAKLIEEGYDKFDVIRSATINPVKHYNLEAGVLQKGQNADFIIVDRLEKMNVAETWINGRRVFYNNRRSFSYKPGKPVNNFNCSPVKMSDLEVKVQPGKMRVIEAFDGELITKEMLVPVKNSKIVEPDVTHDILKIVVKDRYNDSAPAIGFIKGFELKAGAFASSVAHDSHNIVSVGTNDSDISCAINEIIRKKGGLAVSSCKEVTSLQLNIAGIMTTRSCAEVARKYTQLSDRVKSLGSKMAAPFMTLSFMALLVIPEIKISDQGLFDVNKFEPVQLFTGQSDQENMKQ
jgi:adenine deaminase